MADITNYSIRDPMGNVYGPANADMLREWVHDGRIVAGMSIAPEGTQDWVEATAHPLIADMFTKSAAATPAATPTQPLNPAATAPAQHVEVTRVAGSAQPGLHQDPALGYASGLANQTPMNVVSAAALAAGILSILGLIPTCFCGIFGAPCPFVLGVLAIILGIIGFMQTTAAKPANNRWMAIAGAIAGIVAILIAIIRIVVGIYMSSSIHIGP